MDWRRHLPLWASGVAVVLIEGLFLLQGHDILLGHSQQGERAPTGEDKMLHFGTMMASVIIALMFSYLVFKVVQTRQALGDARRDLHSAALARNDAETLHKRLADSERIANLGSWHWNIATGELSWSQQVYRIFGLGASGVVPSYSAFLDAVHPEDRELVKESVRRALAGEAAYDLDHRILRGDGEVRVLHEQGEVLCDRAGKPLQMVGIVHDVTDIRKAERDHLRSEIRLRGVLGIAPEAIIAVNEDGVIEMFNTGAEKIFGYAADAAIGQPLDILLPEKFRGRHLDMMRGFGRAAEQSRLMSARSQIYGRRSDGTEFPAEASIAKLETEGDLLFTVILRDVTERFEQERKILAAKEAAEAASLAKSQFLANMSHELRTPLNAIIGFSQVLQMHTLGPLGNARYDEYVRHIHDSGSHLLTIINDILDISKIESGRVELVESAVDLGNLARRCINLVKGAAQEKSIALSLAAREDMPQVLADELRVKQILINLLGNAVKFTPEDGRIDVSLGLSSSGEATLTISDNGIGISAEKLPLLGQPFVQIDAGLNRRHEGSGLGLALCKELIRLHGGELDLKSEVGRGTKVTVRFPACRSIDASARAATDDIDQPLRAAV